MSCIHFFNEYIKRKIFLLILLVLPGFLAGCHLHSQEKPMQENASLTVSAPLPEPELTSKPQDAEMNPAPEGTASACQHELIVLSKLNQNAYAIKKAEFDKLLSSASVYTSIRDTIDSNTRDTMDSLYKYKTQKLCSDIEQSVRTSLIKRGESLK